VGRLLLVAFVVAACSSDEPAVQLRFTADPGSPGSEKYLCFGFDAARLGGADIGGLVLDAPAGPVTLHHVALYASTTDFGAGPVECEAMPQDAVSLHVWAAGTGDLELPTDLAIAVPAGTTHLIVQAHSLRIDDGPAKSATVEIEPRRGARHLAAWMPLRVPVPAIGPHQQITSSASCVVDGELHVISVWPHMHRIGLAFHGSFVDVDPWVYDAQRAYDVSAVVEAGGTIDSSCTWLNPGDTTVLPGPLLTDEMCEQSVIAWPADAARCR
jgi:hypothetical protein